ncbi:hypothetical protein [Vibrio sp. ER1A]|uniref:hypothetical protein n=1 Tax=Vibrio sp. ER1A TaxID=1517681 RepID=UPI0004DD30E3|nr:hypothetical protein [Vibrio sp. ER1A]KFA99775.1 hypothetical protein HW45_01735 [Vibrio sp. ER1A]
MKVWLSLLLLIFAQLAHAGPAAFGIRINTTTLADIQKTHQVMPITARKETFDPASKFCVPIEQGEGYAYCDSAPHPSSTEHAYTIDIRDSGVQYFEVRTDKHNVVKFMLIKFYNPDEGELSRSITVGDRLNSKYGTFSDEYDLFQNGYFRPVRETINAFISMWIKKGDDHFFVILSDKDYLKTTRYDLTDHYQPQGKSADDQF